MPVPSLITDLTATAAGNYPVGADAVFPELDDHLRAHSAFIKQNYDAIQLKADASALTAYATLSALASTTTATAGDALLGVKAAGTGALDRTQHDVNTAFVDASQYDTLPNAVAAAAAAGYVLRVKDGAVYDLTATLSLTGLRGFVGSAEIRWAGTNNYNGYLLDASENSGIAIGGGSFGEMILRCDTPSICRHGIKMGGGSISTFQSTLSRMSIVGAVGSAGASIAVDGGSSATNALNDGVFTNVRVSGWDIGYQVSAPDNKWFGGTIRVNTGGAYGWGISAINNTKVSVFGTVFSESRYPLRLGHGIWGAACHGCWFEGVVQGMVLLDTAFSEILGDVSFYSCRFDTDSPASYFFDLDNWRPGSLITTGMLRIVGGDIHSIASTSAIRLHNDAGRLPLTVHVDGFTDTLAPITWSGNTSRVSIRGPAAMTIGGVGAGIARHFTAAATPLTFAAIAAGASGTQAVSVPGVRLSADSASVIATPTSGAIQASLIQHCYVSADNTVTIELFNPTSGSITPSLRNWRVEVFTH